MKETSSVGTRVSKYFYQVLVGILLTPLLAFSQANNPYQGVDKDIAERLVADGIAELILQAVPTAPAIARAKTHAADIKKKRPEKERPENE